MIWRFGSPDRLSHLNIMKHGTMAHQLNPFVSIIIPVYNDPLRLTRCLHALSAQTYPREQYEILVVDNGSDESIEPIVAQCRQAKATQELQPGSYAARNTGIALAQGDIVAFTDSDCIPAQDWIGRGVLNLCQIRNCGLVGGKIELFFRDPNHPTAVELFDKYVMSFDQDANINENAFSVTANLFTFQRVIKHVGSFDSTLKSRGDVEWGRRVALSGYTLIYADDVYVAHPARYTFAQLRRRMRRLTGGFEDVSRKNGAFLLKQERQEFSFSFIPSLQMCMRIYHHPHLTFSSKMKIILVGIFVKYVKMQERLRLKMWGNSAR